uniref:Uncharacterized protein n=1 Tax=viral metagenome TaxID=1070528 RepID=A0A6C0EUN6_9ZZZZ
MDTGTFSMILFILVATIGSYLVLTDAVEGRAKMILIVVIAIIIIMLILNLGLFSSSKKIVDSPVAGNSVVKPLSKYNYTASYSLSTWIYVNDWNLYNGTNKDIISRKLDGVNSNPGLYLDPYENQLNIEIQVGQTSPTTQTINVPNINTQKWVNITCCFDDSHVDTYLNGKLVKTYIPANVLYYPTLEADSTKLDFNILPNKRGFSGFLSNTSYYDYFLSPQDSWNIYQKGFSSNMLGNYLNKYNASFTFYKDQNVVGEPVFIM